MPFSVSLTKCLAWTWSWTIHFCDWCLVIREVIAAVLGSEKSFAFMFTVLSVFAWCKFSTNLLHFNTSFVDSNHYARQQQCLATKVLGVHDINWKFYFLHFSFACSSSCHNSLIILCLMEIKDLCWPENKLMKHVAILWLCVALFISHMVRTVYSIYLYRYGKNRESRNKYCMVSWTPIIMATVPDMAT